MFLYTIIFISGGAILALELLASRIMTPYFGVSLYIWTGILSITLIALALGYWLGGKLAAGHASREPTLPRLLTLYLLMPAIAALAIVAACLTYPHTFATLANWSLVSGAFAACLVLLFLPLLAASAMNPLLVAVQLRSRVDARAGDAGAGRVFFVSTLGSVAGVFVTAFGLIPYLSNFAAVLTVALVLAGLAAAAVIFTTQPVRNKGVVAAVALIAVLLAGALLWKADAYTGRLGPYVYSGVSWKLEASYSSLFGTVKVLRTATDPASGRFIRMYFHDGLNQNVVDSSNRSRSFYTYALEALARAYQPDFKRVLVLGLGAGMVPMRLVHPGATIEAVDIDPIARRVAQAHFGYQPSRAITHEADARTFLRTCKNGYDVVVVDLFHGDGTPDYLITREFFSDLRACLAPGGVAVFNTFADLKQPVTYAHLLTTLKTELPQLALYRPAAPGAAHVNSFIVAAAQPLPAPRTVTLGDMPTAYQSMLWNMLASPLPLTSELFEGGRVITDAHGATARDFARMQVTYRRSVVQGVPPAMLMN
jgi:spermidine synthase